MEVGVGVERGAHGSIGGVGPDDVVEVAGHGGSDALEVATLKAGDGAGGQAGCGGAREGIRPDKAPVPLESGPEAAAGVGGVGGEVEVDRLAERRLLVFFGGLGREQCPV